MISQGLHIDIIVCDEDIAPVMFFDASRRVFSDILETNFLCTMFTGDSHLNHYDEFFGEDNGINSCKRLGCQQQTEWKCVEITMGNPGFIEV